MDRPSPYFARKGAHGTLDRVNAPPWLTVLDETITACNAHRRPDLAHRLQRKRGRLLAPQLRVLVLGMLTNLSAQWISRRFGARMA